MRRDLLASQWPPRALGQLLDDGGSIHAWCSNRPGCGRKLELDVYDLVIWLGRRHSYVRKRLPLRCQRCGCRAIEITVSPETKPYNVEMREPLNFRQSRTTAEKRALMAVMPRRR